jgi:hypothetical protein
MTNKSSNTPSKLSATGQKHIRHSCNKNASPVTGWHFFSRQQ